VDVGAAIGGVGCMEFVVENGPDFVEAGGPDVVELEFADWRDEVNTAYWTISSILLKITESSQM